MLGLQEHSIKPDFLNVDSEDRTQAPASILPAEIISMSPHAIVKIESGSSNLPFNDNNF